MVSFPGTIRRKSPLTNPLVAPKKPKWWFHVFFMFSPIWRRFPVWQAYLSNGLEKKTLTSFTNDSMWPCNATTFEFPWRGQCDKINMTWRVRSTLRFLPSMWLEWLFFCETAMGGVKAWTCWYNKGKRSWFPEKHWYRRWAPTSYWTNNSTYRGYNPNCQFIRTFTGVIAPFRTSRGSTLL